MAISIRPVRFFGHDLPRPTPVIDHKDENGLDTLRVKADALNQLPTVSSFITEWATQVSWTRGGCKKGNVTAPRQGTDASRSRLKALDEEDCSEESGSESDVNTAMHSDGSDDVSDCADDRIQHVAPVAQRTKSNARRHDRFVETKTAAESSRHMSTLKMTLPSKRRMSVDLAQPTVPVTPSPEEGTGIVSEEWTPLAQVVPFQVERAYNSLERTAGNAQVHQRPKRGRAPRVQQGS